MIFSPFYYFDTGCVAYVFGCGGRGVGAVVDPQLRDVQVYADFAASKGLSITHVIDTHVHADHRSGGKALAERLGAAYCLHASADVAFPFQALHDGDEIELGNTRIRVLHTPGHTTESMCLVVTDLRRGGDPWFVLTGDTLFVGAVGRSDLPGEARENAGRLFDSLHEKVLTLPAEMELFPAHFAGSACGADLSGKPSSTLAFERKHNPLLSLSRAEFVDALSELPAKPADVDRMLQVNRGRAAS
jgi:hydroxyacylglutathione hydrolase